jgi:peptidoglycan/LPS O-acetylase OafA/YrhL
MYAGIYASLILPLPLLVWGWSRSDRRPIEFSILTLSAVLLLSAAVRSLKLILLGADYSDRLFTTIGVNIFIAIALGLYLGIKRRWLAAAAAGILAFGWLLVGAINSAV